MTAPILSIRGLQKSFGDHDVLAGVDLDLHPAETLVVLGRSGSGKSVLIKVAVALMPPDQGSVEIFGQDIHALDRRALDALRVRLGFSFQHSALYDSMSVRDNLAFPLRINQPDLAASEISDRVEAAIEAVGLAHTLDQMPAELSGGQRKRVGIARTLILEPEIMFYDEPTAGLDPATCGELNDLIVQVRETTGTASIVITHDLPSARAVGDRVAVLHEGRVLTTGPFDEVFATDHPLLNSFHDYAFLAPEASA
jgi:phospholipid/cholesterol/gamma-HCH transport system ATP-binding protein